MELANVIMRLSTRLHCLHFELASGKTRTNQTTCKQPKVITVQANNHHYTRTGKI